MENSRERLHLWHDESGAPYDDGECPYPCTTADDEFDIFCIAFLENMWYTIFVSIQMFAVCRACYYRQARELKKQ